MLLFRRVRALTQTPQGHRLLASGNVAVDKYPRGESHKSTGYTTSENYGHHWCLKISDVQCHQPRTIKPRPTWWNFANVRSAPVRIHLSYQRQFYPTVLEFPRRHFQRESVENACLAGKGKTRMSGLVSGQMGRSTSTSNTGLMFRAKKLEGV